MSCDKIELCGSFLDENFCATYHKKLPQLIDFGSLKLVVVEHPEEIIDDVEQDMIYDYWDALEGNDEMDPDNNRSLVEMQDQLLSIKRRREFIAEVNNGTGYLAFGGKLMQKSFYYVNKHVLFTTEEIPHDFATSMKFASATNIIDPTSCSSYIYRCKSVQNVITKRPLSAKTRSRTTKISRKYPKGKF